MLRIGILKRTRKGGALSYTGQAVVTKDGQILYSKSQTFDREA
jgi:hypothetical protein